MNKQWKKSYKQLYTKMMPGVKSTSYVSSNETFWNRTVCIKKCIKMENSRFAKKCTKNGGYFKCCVRGWFLGPYEEARNQLINDGLIKDEITNTCDSKSKKDRCLFCRANGMCTKPNPSNGQNIHIFYPPKKKKSKSEHKCIINTSLAAPGALAHRLQRRNACKIQNGRQGAQEWPTGSGKMFTPRLLEAKAPNNFR